MNKYPYYIIPDIEEYNSSDAETKQRLARKIAVAIGDPVILRTILGLSPQEFAYFYPDMTLPELSTEETIDTFIDTFGDPAVKEQDDLDRIIVPASTYNIKDLEALPELENGEVDLSSIPTLETPKPKNTASEKVEDLETDFRTCVKNGDYERALEIISQISLNNTKKSIYFADQIRFLKKLIEIKNKKN